MTRVDLPLVVLVAALPAAAAPGRVVFAHADMSPYASPDGATVAFVRLPTEADAGWLMLRGPRGPAVRTSAVVDIRGLPIRLSWSPDGRLVAFTAKLDLAVFDTVSGHVRVYREPRAQWTPTWSPDGTRILYTTLHPRGGLAVLTPATGKRTIVAPDGRQGTWSPGGERIAYVGDDGVYVVAADGTDRRRLASEELADEPAWSPDGTRIAFTAGFGGGVAVAPAAGGAVTFVGRVGRGVERGPPAWSPDGTRVAYIRGDGVVVGTPGGAARRIVAGSGWSRGHVSWTRAGLVVAAPLEGCRGHSGIVRIDPDSAATTTLTGTCRVEGGAAGELLWGTWGHDEIDPGSGRDDVRALDGDDVVRARDGVRDVVDCGAGTRDLVLADPVDLVAHDCERVVRR